MTFEKLIKRNQLITDYLAELAAARPSHVAPDAADRDHYRNVLAAQERLLIATERLLERGHRMRPARAARLPSKPPAGTLPATTLHSPLRALS